MLKFLRLLKLNETLFALPFAYSGLLLAYKSVDDLELIKIIWITLAMIGARTFGMLMNRVIDKQIDSINPRTKDRDLPSGRVKSVSILLIAFFTLVLFIFSAFMLNDLAFYLSPIVAIHMLIYSYTKRFTWLSSFFLGSVLGIAPSGAWIGINASLEKFVIVEEISPTGRSDCGETKDEIELSSHENIKRDISKITNELKWSPKIDLENGLKLTKDYFSKHLKNYLDV